MKVKLLCWKHYYNIVSDRSQFSPTPFVPSHTLPAPPTLPTPKQHLPKWAYKT